METALVPSPRTELAPHTFDPTILAGQVRQSTISMYRKSWQQYAAFAGSGAAALDPATLARWRTELANQQLSPNSINRMLSSVRAVMKEAAAQGYISNETAEAFATVRGVKVAAMKDKLKTHARTKISAEDMRRLCNAPDVTTLAGKMHRALLLTMASSGARISELVTLKPAQIEQRKHRGKTGYVILVSGKTDEGIREAPLSIEAYEAIQAWLVARAKVRVQSEYIFTGFGGRGDRDPSSAHIVERSAWATVRRYAKRLGLEHVKPHDFRRFVGTTLATKDPRQAQKALGHKDISTTYRHYVLDEMEVGLTDGLF